MSRLIDAGALMKDITDSLNQMTGIGIAADGEWLWAKLNDALENAPTIEERKTGKWIKGNDGYIRCSECGCRASAIKARFCHRCGADMRGEE